MTVPEKAGPGDLTVSDVPKGGSRAAEGEFVLLALVDDPLVPAPEAPETPHVLRCGHESG